MPRRAVEEEERSSGSAPIPVSAGAGECAGGRAAPMPGGRPAARSPPPHCLGASRQHFAAEAPPAFGIKILTTLGSRGKGGAGKCRLHLCLSLPSFPFPFPSRVGRGRSEQLQERAARCSSAPLAPERLLPGAEPRLCGAAGGSAAAAVSLAFHGLGVAGTGRGSARHQVWWANRGK